MKDAQGRQVTGRVRWRKFAVLAVPGFAVTAALAVALAQGALAASFAVSGQQFKVRAGSMHGEGFAQYGTLDYNVRDGKDHPFPAVATAIHKATIHELCQSVVTDFPGLGTFSLNVSAGKDPQHPVEATDLVLDLTQLEGNADFTNIEIGRDASTLDKGPKKAKGMQDLFGQQADSLDINDAKQVAWSVNAAKFKLSGLSLSLHKGKQECFR
ncbi:DUF6230 family protein [Streptomyces caatingaensis]|uniref:Cholesterol esterase n=1 Tax=Streptomyces caatingaensis TaxID=1678637 RepID=A0A0K9XHN7_9ACTN|nr:DUF6230 family protein [Streptomyces caatingaensis]KNB52914.1 cholesterol esterase [Streptomyces caatingaensis]